MYKDYELNIPERPYKIFWHGKFLRSYDNKNDFDMGVKFFSGFLIEITTKIEDNDMIDKELMKLVLNKPRIKDIYKLKSNPNLDDFSLPYSLHGDGDLYEINVYELSSICKEWAFFNKFDIDLHRRLDSKWDWQLSSRVYPIAGVETESFSSFGTSDTSYQAIFDACKHLLMHTRNR